MKVAIKANDTSKYQRLSRENQISEADAMLAVQQSYHVVNFIEEFQHEELTYLVTKFVRGGDLLSYL